jgi:aspartate aminotransferase
MSLRLAQRLDGVDRTLIRRIFDSAPAGAINFGLGQPDLPTVGAASLAGIAAIAEGRTAYTATAGDPELRAAIAARYPGFVQGPGSTLVTIGTQEAMVVACLGLLDPGDELLYPEPGYPAYPVVARLIGARGVPYPLRPERGFRLDPRDLEACLTPRTRAVILCSPSNPTGTAIAKDDLARIVERLAERDVPWISDEIYAGLWFDAPPAAPWRLTSRGGLVISGLSKDASMTGWRVGWIVGPDETIARLNAVHQYLVTCAPSISQRAAIAALAPAGLAAQERYRQTFAERREAMARELDRIPRLGYTPPDGAFYFFVDVSAYGDSLEVARRILERRQVITIPGQAFGPSGAGWLRLSFAADLATIRMGMERIAGELAEIAG